MKSKWLFLPAMLVLMAGILITACPSDVDPPERIENANMVFEGGKYRYDFNTPLIEDGKEYQVILTIEACDSDFIGSRLGGKLAYKMDLDDPEDIVLSGWAYAVPTFVSEDVKEYTWTFVAGEANADNVEIANPATTPDGGKQYFSLTAQSGWDNYGEEYNFGVNGNFRVVTREVITSWVTAGLVESLGSDGADGKGAFSEEDMVKIRAMPERSKIVFTVEVTVSSNSSGAAPGNGICGIGGWEDNNSLSITVPADATAGASITFEAEFEIANILAMQPAGQRIAVNPYNGAKVTKAELFRPGN